MNPTVQCLGKIKTHPKSYIKTTVTLYGGQQNITLYYNYQRNMSLWVHKTQLARQRQDKHLANHALSDMVYLGNDKCECWKPKCLPGFRIIKLHGKMGRTKGVTL